MPDPVASTPEDEEAELEAEVQALLRGAKKKKKKNKKDKKVKKLKAPPVQETPVLGTPVLGTPIGYDYEMLLKRAYMLLKRDNPDAETKTTRRLKLPPPNICPYKTTRTCWSNFIQTCTAFQRPPDHVARFVEHELSTKVSISGRQHLIVPMRLDTRGLSQILDRYAKKYVLCIRCKSCDTTFRKNTVQRLHFVECMDCQAITSVPVTRSSSGHVAVKRGDRRKARVTR